MKKAFIFDFDGVIIDDEKIWEKAKKEIYITLFGQEIYQEMGSTVGVNMNDIYKRAVSLGSEVSEDEFTKTFFGYADEIYKTAPLTKGINSLGDVLKELGYSIGIVSASPKSWIEITLRRLSFAKDIKIILSLYDRSDLPHKPNPTGYTEAINMLNTKPSSTIILEDSNAGIASAKAAGAYTIALQQNLVPGYIQKGADFYAKDINKVIEVVKKFSS